MSVQRYFGPELLKFLNELRAHNNRAWFQKNKKRYEKEVRDPFLRFIEELGPELRKINPHMVADPSPVGGSMMRIYRDVRFSKDRSPYKTYVAAHFWHDKGKEGASPAYYLHFEADGSVIGAGVWHPEPVALKRIRDAIVRDTERWQWVKPEGGRGSRCAMHGESLLKPPRGFNQSHPFIEDIKRKDFTAGSRISDKQICGEDFKDTVVEIFHEMAPFVRFLSEAIGLP